MIYIDNAATTFPKPREVYKTAWKVMTKYGANPGRSGHKMALEASNIVYGVREKVADFFGCDMCENVIFTCNTTYSLNLAINGVVKDGMHVVCSVFEHNSVIRPLYKLSDEGRIKLKVFSPSMEDKKETLENFKAAVGNKCDMVVLTACSNVCGYRFPISEIGEICKAKGIIFILDAAQAAGAYEINMSKCNIDILCVPGHKGLLGISGCGMMIVKQDFKSEINPLIVGGSGAYSRSVAMPQDMPEHLEAGTLPLTSIASLGAGIDFINKKCISEIEYHENKLSGYVCEILKNTSGIKVYSNSGAIVLFNVEGIDCDHAAYLLDKDGIGVRAGLHCAPCAHDFLKTTLKGAVRASFGIFNTQKEAEHLVKSIKNIKNFKKTL